MVHESWREYLEEDFKSDYFSEIKKFLFSQIEMGKTILPERKNWFNALSLPPNDVRVVIIGQDPYHGLNQANGFSFSVNSGVRLPPSLKNIFKEIEVEFGEKMNFDNGDLMPWVNQGVMLLNSVLTVELSKPGSHSNIGWEVFTSKIIRILSENFSNKVFILWGNFAKSKEILIDSSKHFVLKSAHPSPFSAHSGFFGNRHFILANEYLYKNGYEKINWIIK